MSKGNMLLGYARGKVGDVVMARARATQRTSAHNANPKDAQTEKQIKRRSQFANLSMIYSALDFPPTLMKGTKSKSKAKIMFTKLNLNKDAVCNTKENILSVKPAFSSVTIACGNINNNNYYGLNISKKRIQIQPWARENYNISRVLPCKLKTLLAYMASIGPQYNINKSYVFGALVDKNNLNILHQLGVFVDLPDEVLNTEIPVEDNHYTFKYNALEWFHLYVRPAEESCYVYYQRFYRIDHKDLDIPNGTYAQVGAFVPFYKSKGQYLPLQTKLLFSESFNKYQTPEWERQCIESFKPNPQIELRNGTNI